MIRYSIVLSLILLCFTLGCDKKKNESVLFIVASPITAFDDQLKLGFLKSDVIALAKKHGLSVYERSDGKSLLVREADPQRNVIIYFIMGPAEQFVVLSWKANFPRIIHS